MTAKVGNIGSFVLGRGKRGNLRRIAIILTIIASLLLYVGGKNKIVGLGYEIEKLEREKRDIERENRSLRIEASSLTSPSRIEEIATKQLGMIRPAEENIVIVKRKAVQKQ